MTLFKKVTAGLVLFSLCQQASAMIYPYNPLPEEKCPIQTVKFSFHAVANIVAPEESSMPGTNIIDIGTIEQREVEVKFSPGRALPIVRFDTGFPQAIVSAFPLTLKGNGIFVSPESCILTEEATIEQAGLKKIIGERTLTPLQTPEQFFASLKRAIQKNQAEGFLAICRHNPNLMSVSEAILQARVTENINYSNIHNLMGIFVDAGMGKFLKEDSASFAFTMNGNQITIDVTQDSKTLQERMAGFLQRTLSGSESFLLYLRSFEEAERQRILLEQERQFRAEEQRGLVAARPLNTEKFWDICRHNPSIIPLLRTIFGAERNEDVNFSKLNNLVHIFHEAGAGIFEKDEPKAFTYQVNHFRFSAEEKHAPEALRTEMANFLYRVLPDLTLRKLTSFEKEEGRAAAVHLRQQHDEQARQRAEEARIARAEQEHQRVEEQARIRAEQERLQREQEQARIRSEQERQRVEEEVRIRAEQERQRIEEARVRAEQERLQREQEEAHTEVQGIEAGGRQANTPHGQQGQQRGSASSNSTVPGWKNSCDLL
ncbi:MAG: hypothetical protein JSS34_03075 [Proteobacteria bacterium]|nr:hypothetical protein [Pseudomonadota bacterium]